MKIKELKKDVKELDKQIRVIVMELGKGEARNINYLVERVDNDRKGVILATTLYATADRADAIAYAQDYFEDIG